VGKLVPLPEGVAPDVIICDTPGRIDVSASSPDPFFRDLISRSDRLVIVAEKSLFSTQASIPMVESVKQFMSPTARAMILFNKVRRRTLVGGQNEEEMGRDLGLPVLKNSLPLAAAYESTQIQGFSVVVSKNRERIFQLALEILR
jgi:Flp pilus assembly CpaE family ATPase